MVVEVYATTVCLLSPIMKLYRLKTEKQIMFKRVTVSTISITNTLCMQSHTDETFKKEQTADQHTCDQERDLRIAREKNS